MLEIAQNNGNSGIYQKDISEKQSISNKYLDHIIHALKASHLIANVKGKKSGYMLTREPSKITIFDIHNAFEPGICLTECLSGNYKCDRREGCLTVGFWGQLNNIIVNYFKSVTLEDLMLKRVSIEDDEYLVNKK